MSGMASSSGDNDDDRTVAGVVVESDECAERCCNDDMEVKELRSEGVVDEDRGSCCGGWCGCCCGLRSALSSSATSEGRGGSVGIVVPADHHK